MSKGWALIINPQSKSGATKKKMATVKRLLKFNKIHFLFFETRNSGDELNIVEKAVKEGFRKIVCVGGDGTIQKIIAGIQRQETCSPKEIVVGIIPLGTGNDWAKSIEVPLNIEKAKRELNWRPKLNFDETIKLTIDWYKNYLDDKNMEKITSDQINYFTNK